MMSHFGTLKIGPSLFSCEIEILYNVHIVQWQGWKEMKGTDDEQLLRTVSPPNSANASHQVLFWHFWHFWQTGSSLPDIAIWISVVPPSR